MTVTISGSQAGGTVISSGTVISGNTTIYGDGAYQILSGASVWIDGNSILSGSYVDGFGSGPSNSGAPGTSAGTNYPSLLLVSGANALVSASTAVSGGVIMAANQGKVSGGTAYDSGSFVAGNQGTVNDVTIGSNGGVLASMVSGRTDGAAGLVTNAHVLSGGGGLAGGGFTIKGQAFAGSGIISGSTFDVGATEALVSGGSDVNGIFGGVQLVSSGGRSIGSIFSAGTQILSYGGVGSGNVVSAGGVVSVGNGGTSLNLIVGSAGSAHVYGGGSINVVAIEAGAAIAADAQAYVAGATVSSGGTLNMASGSVLSNGTVMSGGSIGIGGTGSRVTVSAGGTLFISSGATLVGGTINGTTNSGSYGGLLTVQSGAVLSNVSIGWRGRIDVDTLSYDSNMSAVVSGRSIMIQSGGVTLWSAPISTSPSSINVTSNYHLERDSDGTTIIVFDKCFLRGTLIRTDRGEVPVESLVVGDRVAAFKDGGVEYREIIWAGHRSAQVRPGLNDDEAGYPVRFRKDSLGENVPSKDLLVTPEHAMYLDGAFVPARLLVNGQSICFDRSITRFDYFHVETADHSILWSDGALSESYLDTGDRQAFAQGSPVVRLLNAPPRSWERDAAAPLCVEPAFVQSLYTRLKARADQLGHVEGQAHVETTADADLHLVDGSGKRFNSVRIVGNTHVFMLPADAADVRIRSRVSRPVDVVGPYHDDRRSLGVLIGSIQVWSSDTTRELTTHLDAGDLEGWANVEDGRRRWTTGNAVLPFEKDAKATVLLAIEILAGGPYLIQNEEISSVA